MAWIPCWCGCGVGWQLWAPIPSLAWELLYARGAALKRPKKKKKKKKRLVNTVLSWKMVQGQQGAEEGSDRRGSERAKVRYTMNEGLLPILIARESWQLPKRQQH